MTPREFLVSLQELPQPQFFYMCVATLALLFLLVLLLRRQPKNVVAYSTENGRVMVSRHAIVELVQTSCEQLQDVSKPQVKIQVKGKSIHFEVRIKLLSGGRLRSIEQTLQSHLRRALTENLGIEHLGRINIMATGFKSGRIDSSIAKKSNTPPAIETAEAYDEPTDEADAFDGDTQPKKD
jgi:hypothetical protein